MVKIAVAGGSGQVAQEVIDALLDTGKHEITILSRNEASIKDVPAGIRWRVVNYNDQPDLVDALQGIHTLFSFVQLLLDPEGMSQKILIDAAIAAGVKRFAPSEYGSAGTTNMPWWAGKESTRDYLRKVNGNEKVLEYIVFQPGLFLDYLAFPYKTAKHIDPLQSVFDYHNCRAIVVNGHEDAIMTLTTAADVAAIVAQAVDYKGEWPETGGIRGNRVTFSEVIKIGEKIRGRPFTIEKVNLEDLEAGTLNTPWALAERHRAISEEQHDHFAKMVSIGILLSSAKGAWDVSDELNQLFPEYNFDKVEDFLTRVWNGKQ
ncbi:NAD(P)-binding protein [Rhizodiscina lignyota]|uniref:NAD(P)-binding protein n=1 Tax=Rhizodiscina lignyota TaxID=1504668 RepID=A0A9P4M3M2_9PEZI|nr:NAD(P)-binding protein [Rhizodiscina lignyota]